MAPRFAAIISIWLSSIFYSALDSSFHALPSATPSP